MNFFKDQPDFKGDPKHLEIIWIQLIKKIFQPGITGEKRMWRLFQI